MHSLKSKYRIVFAPTTVLSLTLIILLSACVSNQPTEFSTAEPLETSRRIELIDKIIAKDSLYREIKPLTTPALDEDSMGPFLENKVIERKLKMGISLPDNYWALYRNNIFIFNRAVIESSTHALNAYIKAYKVELSLASDEQLEAIAGSVDMESSPIFKSVINESLMGLVYLNADSKATRKAIDLHKERMAQMDVIYNVCARYAACWQ